MSPVTGVLPRPAAADLDSGGPIHVAVIMDGNGRWAQARGLPRTLGHRKGVEAVRRTVRHAVRRGLGYLTLYTFSMENWKRPAGEVSELMALLRGYIRTDLDELVEANIRIRVIGERETLSGHLLELIETAEGRTANGTGMTLVVAFNYSGRNEILRATRRLARATAAGALDPAAIDETTFADAMDTHGIPDPDLVIRTSGEVRVSNFLLWQCAYSEFVFPSVLWPDFDEQVFDAALTDFARRTRRFGMVSGPV